MSALLMQILRRDGIRFWSSKTFTIPLNTIVQKRRLFVGAELNQKQADSAKKAKDAIKITLHGPNNSISVISLEDAKHLSRRRDLELVKIQDLDGKTQRPVYKLLTKAELLSQENADLGSTDSAKKSSAKKGEKNLTIGSRITDHDLLSRLKNISKWISKGHEVRILIQCASDDAGSGEKIFNRIETAVKEEGAGKIVQKRVKGANIKFSILPISKKDS